MRDGEEKWIERNLELIEDPDLRALAKVCLVVTQEKLPNERWPRFGRRAFWFPQIHLLDKKKPEYSPRIVSIVKTNDIRQDMIDCVEEIKGQLITVPYHNLLWIPDVQDFLNFEEWPISVSKPLGAWVMSHLKVVQLRPKDTDFVKMVTQIPEGEEVTPLKTLLIVALAWLKAYTEPRSEKP